MNCFRMMARTGIDWAAPAPFAPLAPGVHCFDHYPLSDLVSCIDWMPFFNAWEFSGQFPAVLTDPVVGEAASNLYADAREMLKRLVAERLRHVEIHRQESAEQDGQGLQILAPRKDQSQSLARSVSACHLASFAALAIFHTTRSFLGCQLILPKSDVFRLSEIVGQDKADRRIAQ